MVRFFGAAGNVAGIAQLARASAFQAECRGFESRFPLQSAACIVWVNELITGDGGLCVAGDAMGRAHVAQSVEHMHGKHVVTGSIPVVGSTEKQEV